MRQKKWKESENSQGREQVLVRNYIGYFGWKGLEGLGLSTFWAPPRGKRQTVENPDKNKGEPVPGDE